MSEIQVQHYTCHGASH